MKQTDDEVYVNLNFRCPITLKRQAELLATMLGLSLSDLARLALENAVKDGVELAGALTEYDREIEAAS